MRLRLRATVVASVVTVAAFGLGVSGPRAAWAASPVPAPDAAALWDRYCLACHGDGDGAGPGTVLVWPRPRDLRRGRMKWRSTASGTPAADADLLLTLRRGAPGTTMPGFDGILDGAQLAALVAHVRALAPARPAGRPVALPPRPATPDLARGRALYASLGCAACHGANGAGDGPAAAALTDDAGRPARPHDLAMPHRPRAGDAILAAALTLATGVDGTPMPSFEAALPGDALWDLAGFVASLERPPGPPARGLAKDDPRARTPIGLDLAPQGPPPPSLPPAATSLSASQCGRCHARQLADFRTSVHARASSPGLLGQYDGQSSGFVKGCQRCHAPLAEQLASATQGTALRDEGITCAACHVRGHVRRGPPRRADSGLLAVPSYPFVVDLAYERSDFCQPCHQLSPIEAVAGKPLLDTYREWLVGPYMPRGIQCQHCHMPERAHTWKGVHDPETVRQGVSLRVAARRDGGRVVIDTTLANVGAGHMLPTTPTPALWLVVELLAEDGAVIGRSQRRIGRHLRYTRDGWRELEDSRIPPGGVLAYAPAWDRAAVPRATRARVALRVDPDDYYVGFYRTLLAGKPTPAARNLLDEALRRALASSYVALTRELALPR